MTKDEIREYLKENLTVEIVKQKVLWSYYDKEIVVRLKLEYNIISEDKIKFTELPEPQPNEY